MSYEELKAKGSTEDTIYTACFGYIFKLPFDGKFYKPHIGRDVTSLMLRYWRKQPTDPEDDDQGKPPYPDYE